MSALSPRLARAAWCAALILLSAAHPAWPQTPTTATLTRWDVFAATGGVDSTSTTATRNTPAVAVDPNNTAIVWYAAQRPNLRLGQLDTNTGLLTEWDVPGSPAGAPTGLAVTSTGDVWLTTSGSSKVVRLAGGAFVTYDIPSFGTQAVTGFNGFFVNAAAGEVWLPATAGSSGRASSIVRLDYAANAAQRYTVGGVSSNSLRDVVRDSAGNVWFTSKASSGSWLIRLKIAPSAGFTAWGLPTGMSGPAGLYLKSDGGPSVGATELCLAAEGTAGSYSGQAMCFDASAQKYKVFNRSAPATALGFAQQVSGSGAGELFVTEQGADAVSFLAPSAATVDTLSPAGTGTPAIQSAAVTLTVTTTAVVSRPMPPPLTPDVTGLSADPASPAGQPRFALPPLAALPDQPGVSRQSRPVGLSSVFADSGGAGTGSVYVAEYFDGPVAPGMQMAGAISLLTLGGAAPDALVVQSDPLVFSATVGDMPEPASIIVSVESESGSSLSWTATASDPWISVSPASGDTPASFVVSITHGTATPVSLDGSVTLSAPGVDDVVVPVSFDVVERPTITVAPLSLAFASLTTDLAPPAPQSFSISGTGTTPLEWTATLTMAVPAALCTQLVAGTCAVPLASEVSGTGDAVITVFLTDLPPGVPDTHQGSVAITSNATAPAVTVDLVYEVSEVTQPFLAVDKSSITLTAARGGPAVSDVVRLSNADPNNPITWGTSAPYTYAAPPPSWLSLSLAGCASTNSGCVLAAGGYSDITFTVDPASLAPGTHSAVVTIDDHTGNSAPALVAVSVVVQAPTIDLAPAALALTAERGTAAATQVLTVLNSGDGALAFTPQVVMNSGSGWLVVSPAGHSSVGAGGSLGLTVTATPDLAPGVYTGAITINDPNATNTPQSAGVTFTVTPDVTAPVLTLPGTHTLEATGASTPVTFVPAPSATDGTDGAVPVSCVPASGSGFSVGTTPVLCSAADSSGNVATGNFDVIVHDTTPPAISGTPADTTIEATAPVGAAFTFASPTALDLVDGAVAVTCAPSSGATFPLGTTPVVCIAQDSRGNAASAGFSVTVRDTTAPTVTAPADITVEGDTLGGAHVTFTATASDVVSGTLTAVCSPASGSLFGVGSSTVTCSATDGAGQTGSASFTVTVTDTQAPSLVVPADITVEGNAPGGATVTFTAAATDVVSGPLAPVCAPASGSTFPLGTTLVACSASDGAGLTATASFNVTVADTTPPVIGPLANLTLEATGPGGALATFAATATDAVGAVTIGYSHSPGTTFPLGVTTVTVTATDESGNSATASFGLTVQDTTAPAIDGMPADATLEATGPAGALFTYTPPTATDLVDGTLPVVCTPGSGSTFALGSSTVTCTAVDARGNVAASTSTVTVQDTTPPAITGVPGAATLEATGPAGAVFTFPTTPAAVDLVDGTVAVTCAPASGSTFAPGTTTVTCTAADARGNDATASFTVTVTDSTPPLVTVPANITVEGDTLGGAVVTFTATATDAVSGALTPTCTPASGALFGVGTTTVTCSATDGAGQTASASFVVTVTDTTPPTVTPPTVPTIEATGPGGASATFAATATDVVSVVTISYSQDPGTTFPLGTTMVTATAIDEAGNSATASFAVRVDDTTAPAITGTPANATLEATGAAGAAFTYAAPTAADLVDGSVAVSCSPASGATFGLGATTVTCSAADTRGNSASTTFTVTVLDTTPPTLALPADITVDATSAAGAVVTFTATAADLVAGTLAVTCTPASGSTFPVGMTTVTCSATDPANNTATGTFSVTVNAANEEGRMTGGGYFHAPGARVSFAFFVRERQEYGERAHLGVHVDYEAQHQPSGRFFARTVTAVAFSDDPAFAPGHRPLPTVDSVVFSGVGDWNGQPGYRYEVQAADRGEPGRGRDTFAITIRNPAGTVVLASYGGVLAGGNIQSHRLPGRVPTPPDVTAPTLMLPGNLVEEADSPLGARVHYRAWARDDRDRRVEVECTPAPGTRFPLGVTTVTCEAVDEAGNTAAGSFTVTVRDTEAPELRLPRYMAVTTNSAAGAVVTFGATAWDEASGTLPVTCMPPSGSLFQVGSTTVTCTAIDAAGNVATGDFRVTVRKRR